MAMLLLVGSIAWAGAGDTPATGQVKGSLTAEDSPLPGGTITLESPLLKRTTVTDIAGMYLFDAVPAGTYELTFTLLGFETKQWSVTVQDGSVITERADLRLAEPTVTYGCGTPCDRREPKTSWEYPSCADFELHSALIDTLEKGDRSALDFLRRRYESTVSRRERNRLALVLFGRLPDDSAMWKELANAAEEAVRFAGSGNEPSPEYVQYCQDRGVEPGEAWANAWDAFVSAAEDPRSRPLLLRALATDDADLIDAAIRNFASRHDREALVEIEKTLKRLPEEKRYGAFSLFGYGSDETDALALQFLNEEERAVYEQAVAERAAREP
jgi:hypothetical protein